MDGTLQMTVRAHNMAQLSNTSCKVYKQMIMQTNKYSNQTSASPRFPMEQKVLTLKHLAFYTLSSHMENSHHESI